MSIQLLSQKFFDYSKYIKGYSPYTIARYRQVINYFSAFANISEINEVTPENTRNLFYYGRTEQKWTPNTFICYHKSLGVFFRWCIKEGYLKDNPIEDIEVPKLEKRIPEKLTKQDAMKILEVVDNYPYQCNFLRFRNYAIFSTFIYTGIRKKNSLILNTRMLI